jgi:hypothetical protein
MQGGEPPVSAGKIRDGAGSSKTGIQHRGVLPYFADKVEIVIPRKGPRHQPKRRKPS